MREAEGSSPQQVGQNSNEIEGQPGKGEVTSTLFEHVKKSDDKPQQKKIIIDEENKDKIIDKPEELNDKLFIQKDSKDKNINDHENGIH